VIKSFAHVLAGEVTWGVATVGKGNPAIIVEDRFALLEILSGYGAVANEVIWGATKHASLLVLVLSRLGLVPPGGILSYSSRSRATGSGTREMRGWRRRNSLVLALDVRSKDTSKVRHGLDEFAN